ncbi:MAG: nucleotidyltransferase family protein [Burkholderiaceae bacterium]|nr:nucleotidyltransferase family protein [Burkholderiaceae bacterium]
MDRASILALLQEHRDVISKRFGAKHLALFGSAARDEMRSDSDVDVLVDFDGPATFDGYFDLKDYLEGLLCRPVDLVTRKGLKPRARQHVERDLIRVT